MSNTDQVPSSAPSVCSALVIDLSPRESECIVCGRYLVNCKRGLAMYEGCVVPDDWTGDWGGFDACQECFARHQRGEMPLWPEAPNEQGETRRP